MKKTISKLQWAEAEANRLIKEFTEKGLIKRGWKFGWKRSIYIIGYCHHRRKTIYLSRHFVRASRKKIIREILVHECLHGFLGRGFGHGPEWKNLAIKYGIKPSRVTNINIIVPPRYLGTCPVCKQEYKQYRKLKGMSERWCCDEDKPIKWKVIDKSVKKQYIGPVEITYYQR